jgi:hypothetical protein
VGLGAKRVRIGRPSGSEPDGEPEPGPEAGSTAGIADGLPGAWGELMDAAM